MLLSVTSSLVVKFIVLVTPVTGGLFLYGCTDKAVVAGASEPACITSVKPAAEVSVIDKLYLCFK